jgi:hypothetical protein
MRKETEDALVAYALVASFFLAAQPVAAIWPLRPADEQVPVE